MKILVANLGSTSFKYRLFDMADERQLARGGAERIGSQESQVFVEMGGPRTELTARLPDHAAAVKLCLEQLTDPAAGCLKSAQEVSAIGFKAVHAGKISGAQRVTPALLSAMEELSPVAPAHNPPYITAMRLLHEKLPHIPMVAAFETGFHQTIPARNRHFAIPHAWAEELGVLRYGFHGASHCYIATRMAQLLGRADARVISCHLGGSSSLCAIKNGQSQANTLAMSPQSGLPHNNRVGDFDVFALPYLLKRTGLSLDQVLGTLASKSGLLGLSGVSGDVRDLEQAAQAGNSQAETALAVMIGYIRQYLGGYLVELGGADAIVFTGGIGENGKQVRARVCQGLEELGIVLCPDRNQAAKAESTIHADNSRVQLWVVPTNEEIVVARQTRDLLQAD